MSAFLKKHPSFAWLALVVLATSLSIAIAWAQKGGGDEMPAPLIAGRAPDLHSVIIKPGPVTPRLDTGIKDRAGNPVTAACGTCHSTTTPNIARNSATDLIHAHSGLTFKHGSVSCLSCHNAQDYDTLHLADGRSLDFPDVMTLCAQCHGTQKRDYDHGSHGGMNGYWDLTKGGRIRNNCVNCHDPHNPEFPLVRPVLPPRDRISVPKSEDTH